MGFMVVKALLHPGMILYLLALLDIRLWRFDDIGTSPGCHGHCYHSLTVVAMAAEEDVSTNVDHSLKDVTQQSIVVNEEQKDAQHSEGDDPLVSFQDTTTSTTAAAAAESHDHQVDTIMHTRARSSHTPTPCKSSDYLRDILTQATRSSALPVCTMEPGMEHVDSVLETVDLHSASSSQGQTVTKLPLGEFEEDENKTNDVGGVSGMEDGVYEGTAKSVKEEAVTQDEDILTFEEFKQHRMMEAQLHQQEKLKNSELPSNGVVRDRVTNNYASLECGAKVIATNNEMSNPKAILQENRDIYMLSPCSADIWFIVELCDTVLVHSIEIATFELFSSVPEAFVVYTSSRYPAIEWSLIGEFKARDVRDVQSFPLDESIYAKYIKVELISHFGSEHYCPLSLLRVLGTSFIQEYEDSEEMSTTSETTTVILDGTDHAALEESQEGNNHSSLLVAAKDAVLHILNGLMGPGSDSTSSQQTTSIMPITSPDPATTTDSSNSRLPTDLPGGQEVENSTNVPTQSTTVTTHPSDTVVTSLLVDTTATRPPVVPTPYTEAVGDTTPTAATSSTATNTTLTDHAIVNTSYVGGSPSVTQESNVTNPTVLDDVSPSLSGSHDTNSYYDNSNKSTIESHDVGSGDAISPMSTNASNITITSHNSTEEDYDNTNGDETYTDSLPTQHPPLAAASQQQQKSSVLIRLSNRIKELEVNMTLFGDYLEQVRTSLQRNKNRTDDLQKSIERRLELLNNTMTALRNETEMGWVLLLQLHEDIQALTKATVGINQSLKHLQEGWVSWNHVMSEAILIVIVVAGYHAYYRSQWEAQMTAVISRIMKETNVSTWRPRSNSDLGYHDNITEYRDTVETLRRKKKPTSKLKQSSS